MCHPPRSKVTINAISFALFKIGLVVVVSLLLDSYASFTMPSTNKRQLRHQQLSVKPVFTPLNQPNIYLINRCTDSNMLHDLIRLAQRTKFYSIDTESDRFTRRPALIQIEFIDQTASVVILVETCHLPVRQQSLTFWLIRSLFKFIFVPSNVIYSWADAKKELVDFVRYGLFAFDTIQQLHVVDVQAEFKHWYSSTYADNPTGTHPWALQVAISTMFDEFLDKTETLNRWSRGLSLACAPDGHNSKLACMIQYAVNDCLAVTKLACAIGEHVVRRWSNGTSFDLSRPSI